MKGIGMKMFSGYTVAAAMLAAATLAGCPPELHTQELKGANELNGKQLYYIPIEGEKRLGETQYARTVSSSTQLAIPVTPEHLPVQRETLIDLEEPVAYFGVLYYNIIVSANGTIVLTNKADAKPGANKTLADHFKSRQVSLLPLDATLQETSLITLFQDKDQLVITYKNVKVGSETDNLFQATFVTETGYDGDLIVNYAKVNSKETTGVVGLSNAPLEGVTDDAKIKAFIANFGGGSVLTSPSTNTPAS